MANLNAKPLIQILDKDNPDGKRYLVLIVGVTEKGEDFKSFEFITGRQTVYDYIKGLITADREYGSIDIHESAIVITSDPVETAKPIYDFMKAMVMSGKIEDPGFDIDDYYVGEDVEEYNEEEEEDKGEE